MIRRPPRSTRVRSSAASDVYKRQRGKRTENQVDVVDADQLLVIRDHLDRAARIVDYVERYLASEQTALGVDVVGPELVALLERFSISGEISCQRKRHTDLDRCARLAGLGSRGRGARAGTASEHEGHSASTGDRAHPHG